MKKLSAAALTGVMMCASATLSAQNEGQQVLQSANSSLQGLGTSLVTLLKTVLGLGALVMLVIVIFKVLKGDREAAEKLAWWVAGFTIGFVLITVVQNVTNL